VKRANGRYAPACIKLLAQYKSLMKLVGDDIGGIESFMKRFKVRPPILYHNRSVVADTYRWTTQPLCIG
jgi:hypothetical protein